LGVKPPGTNRTRHCDSNDVLDDRIGPVEGKHQQQVQRNVTAAHVRFTDILLVTIFTVEGIHNAYKGHGPDHAPTKGHNNASESKNRYIGGTAHCTQSCVQICGRKGDAIPIVHGLQKGLSNPFREYQDQKKGS
jgi:hypothetical protein